MSDFLFSIGADAAEADAAVQEFVKRANAALGNVRQVQLDTSKAIADQKALLNIAEQRLRVEQQITSAQKSVASGGSGSSSNAGFKDISSVALGNASAIGKQKDALDFLNRIMGNTVFKFVEYELVMKAFNSAVGEVFNSLNEASNVQMETVLQRIYNAQINTNQALKDAIIIAKQWGSDITDVQQAIGLWTKQTSQMHDATGRLVDSQTALAAAAKLAADAEKFHRASGIDSLEVYQKSVSIWHELGLSLGQIPHLYDQIAFAATKISPVLKAQPGTTSKQEGIKDIFEGMAESGATLRAQGMDDALIIATVAKQIENLGSTGTKVGTQISTMFGSLNQGGKQLKEWVNILGPGAFKDSESFMDAAIAKVDELKQAQADGLLHVKPQTMNTWRTFLETLSQVKELADQIRGKSSGTLDIIAGAQMNTYNGQVERLKASFQELNLALGIQLLPTTTRFIGFLSGTMLPTLSANSGAVAGFAQLLAGLGSAYLIALGITKVSTAFQAFVEEGQSAALTAQLFRNSELDSVAGMDAATASMERQKAALALLAEQQKVALWQTEGLNAACKELGITEAALAEVTATRLPAAFAAAGTALGGFAARAVTTLGPLLAIYSTMSALQNFDKMARVNLAVDSAVHDQEGGLKSILDTTGDIVKSPLLLPDGNVANDLRDRIRANGGAPARQLNDAMWTLYNNPRSTNDQKTDAGEVIKQLLQDEYNKLHHNDVKGYDKLDDIDKHLQAMMSHLYGGTPAGMTLPGPGTAKGSGKGQATEQQIAAEQTNKIKADAMAEISKWRDTANAAGSYAKTLMDIGKTAGFTDPLLARITGHINDQRTALQNGENAAKNEIAALQTQQQHLKALLATHGASIDAQGNLHGGGKSSAVYGEYKSWRMAEEAITKATGALNGYEAAKAKLSLEASQMLGEAKAWAAIHDAISNQPKTITSVTSTHSLSFLGYKGIVGSGSSPGEPLASPEALDSYIKGLDQNLSQATTTVQKFNIATSQVSTLKELGATIFKLYTQTKDPQELIAYSRALSEIDKAGGQAAKGIAEAQKSTAEFDKNISNLVAKTAATDAEGIGKLLGLSSGDIDAQKTLIDGYNQINDALQQINGWITQQAGSYNNLDATQRQMVQNAINYLNIQQQLIPLLAQQQQIESSIAYQATQATLQQAGQVQIDQAINRLMGTQSNSRVREQLYAAAKDGTWMSPAQSMLKDYLTNTIGDWWKQTVKQMTSTMFGDPATQARKLEESMLKTNRDGLTKIVQDEKTQVVDQLFNWEKLFAADVQKLVQAQQQANANGSGSNTGGDGSVPSGIPSAKGGGQTGTGAQGTEANPTVVTTVGDGNQGLFSGMTSQKNLATAVAAGFDSSSAAKQTAANTGATADASTSAASTYQQQATQGGSQYPQYGGNGLLSSLLGPLASIPGLSNYLSTNGSWLNGLANSAGEGAGFGTMFGGAGSTNTTWGSIGGMVGFGAGMALGGPAGAQIGGMIGGIFGGLFGHSVNPLDEPDVYDTQNYGKFVANVNGAGGTFNGTYIAPDPQYDLADGGTPLDRQMIAWAQKNPNNPIGKQLLSLGPRLDIASEYQGEFTLGSGKTISVTAYESLVQQYLSAAGAQQLAPIVSVNSYGGGGAAGAYNTPGMDSSTFLQQEAAWAQGTTNGSQSGPVEGGTSGGTGGGGSSGTGGYGSDTYGGSAGLMTGWGDPNPLPTATPGYGGSTIASASGRGPSLTSIRLQIATPVYLDGKLLTQIVNAYNAQAKSNAGSVAVPRSSYQ